MQPTHISPAVIQTSYSLIVSVPSTQYALKVKGKGKGHSEGTSLQKRSGMARIVEGFHSFTCTPTCLSTSGMNHTCLCLPSQSWLSFTNPGEMEGRVNSLLKTTTWQLSQLLGGRAITPHWAAGAREASDSTNNFFESSFVHPRHFSRHFDCSWKPVDKSK